MDINTTLGVLNYVPYKKPSFGTCVDFDGLSEYIVSHFSAFMNNDFTIEVWVKDFGANSVSGDSFIFTMYNTRFSVANNDSLRWTIRSVNGSFTRLNAMYVSSNINPATWTHMVARHTVSTGLVELIINNALVTSASLLSPHANANDYFAIGRANVYGTSGSGYYKGKLDDLRIYHRKMTDDEIAYSYNDGLGNLPLNMTALYMWLTFES
ncbi:MAG: LamG domain-containing protein, partial [Bacteroidota bacterium]|nr:LamG domain-containing protein [Bacteroidota bacterium]